MATKKTITKLLKTKKGIIVSITEQLSIANALASLAGHFKISNKKMVDKLEEEVVKVGIVEFSAEFSK